MQQPISEESEALLGLIQSRLSGEKDLVANTATCTSLLFEGMEAVDWVGLYFLREGELVLGPFQGRAARARVPLSHPIAGSVIRKGRTLIIDDLTSFALDDDDFPARSQILVPLFLHERIVALLQVDSPFVNRFKTEDQYVLERAVSLLLSASNTTSLIPKHPATDLRKKAVTHSAGYGTYRVSGSEDPPPGRWLLEPPVRSTRYPARGSESPYHGKPSRRRSGLRPTSPTPRMVVFRRIFASMVIGSFFVISLQRSMLLPHPSSQVPLQVTLEKSLSILAFAGIGFCFALGWRSSIRRSTFQVALFCLLIEIAQMLLGSHKSLIFHAIDILCAIVGGYLGAAIVRAIRRKRNTSQGTSREKWV